MRYGDKSDVSLARRGKIAHDSDDSSSEPAWTMASPRQGDLFDSHDDSDERETPTYYPDPDEVRAELHRMLAEARAAKELPWDASKASLYRTIFPQMTNCLPEEEAAQLRFEFDTEMDRLEAA